MIENVNISDALNGVGKKVRNRYLNGDPSTSTQLVVSMFKRNKKEADAFDPFGWSINDLNSISRNTHNPLLRDKVNLIIEQFTQKSKCSIDQNKLSLQKLDYYLESALGLGLRGVMKELNKIVCSTGNVEAKILLLLMQMEFANLVAKKRHKKKHRCYERKDLLLMQLSDLLYENNWKCGLSYSTGKTASYLVFVYLPNGQQVSWHCNNYRMAGYFDEEDFSWDGQACSTFDKLLAYAHEKYCIGTELAKFVDAA